MTTISLLVLLVLLAPAAYLFLLALASLRPAPSPPRPARPVHRFAIAVPAHDEGSVIGDTVRRLRALDYPPDLFAVHVVADHCADQTASLARQAGAQVHERRSGDRSGKGAALSWLFQRILAETYDAVVIFDADTQVDPAFLRVMDARLAGGDQVIQGQHVISNPEDGWFPALTWAMFLVDNRFQNWGRASLGWSAKHMGDSICFRADVLQEMGWGAGLTEDYHLRQRLLLAGLRIAYEPATVGYGEAPQTWGQAQAQRARWLRGTRDASRKLARRLLRAGIRQRNGLLLDGALQAYLPSYSTLTLIMVSLLLAQIGVNWWWTPAFSPIAIAAWTAVAGLLFIYPLFGLALERAPLRAYVAILSGPFFIFWRTWLALTVRLRRGSVPWIRTAHGRQDG